MPTERWESLIPNLIHLQAPKALFDSDLRCMSILIALCPLVSFPFDELGQSGAGIHRMRPDLKTRVDQLKIQNIYGDL